jgi:hypothetical protein
MAICAGRGYCWLRNSEKSKIKVQKIVQNKKQNINFGKLGLYNAKRFKLCKSILFMYMKFSPL